MAPKITLNSNVINALTMVALGLISGTSFILIKKGLVGFEPVQLVSIRVGLVGLFFLPFFFGKKGITSIHKKHLLPLAAVGWIGSALPFFLFAVAETQIDSGVAGVLNSLQPLFTMIIGFFLFKISVTKDKITGIIISFVGVIALIFLTNYDKLEANYFSLFVVLATICYGTSGNIVQKYLQDVPVLKVTGFSYVFAGIPMLLLAFFIGVPEKLMSSEEARISFGYIAILAMVCTTLAGVLYFQLIIRTSAAYASFIAYIMPVVATIWAIFDGETVTFLHWVCMAIILSGIVVASGKLKKNKKVDIGA